MMAVTAVVFDLGNVVIEWDPRRLYRPLFAGDEEAMERFLAEVATPAWNTELDRGRPFAEAIAELSAAHPDHAELIEAYGQRWPETLGPPIEGTVAIMAELKATGVPLYALSNWSSETFPVARERHAFLAWFEGIVLSGEEGVAKPDPAIFQRLVERYDLHPSTTVFVDDSATNVEAAVALGFVGLVFVGSDALRRELVQRGVVPPLPCPPRPSGGRP